MPKSRRSRKKSLDRTRKWLEGENGGGVKVDSPHYVAVIGKVLQLQIAEEIGEESIEEGYQGQRRKRELDQVVSSNINHGIGNATQSIGVYFAVSYSTERGILKVKLTNSVQSFLPSRLP